MSNIQRINMHRQLTLLDVLYSLQAASIYPKTFQLDTFNGIELVLQA
jgi:hypothetical protein